MRDRRVIAYHFIWTTYGFWLPNDPRGSGSDRVRAWHLRRFGAGTRHKVTNEQSVADAYHDVDLRVEAKQALKHPTVKLNGIQVQACANGLARYLQQHRLRCTAATLLPDHVHMVVLRDEHTAEYLLPRLKAAATQGLNEHGIHPGPDRKVWARGGRHRFIDSDGYLAAAIRYVEDNPQKSGFPRQRWRFVEQP